MAAVRNIAYLTSVYARASDTFIRGEVQQLRALGLSVHTFSIRRAPDKEVVSEEIRQERDRTEYLLLRGNLGALFSSTVLALIKSPRAFFEILALALRSSKPGLKGHIWSLAYLMEACFLADRMREKAVQHLHNHIGEGSAVVAMLAARLANITYSLTIHGPAEFDNPAALALGEKIGRSAFTIAVSEYGRSQLLRWVPLDIWSRVKVVHCGLDEDFLSLPAAPIPSEPRLVFVGRLVLEKGLFPLIEAVRALAETGVEVELRIVGDGPWRPSVEQMIERYSLTRQIKLLGWMNAKQLQQEILAARAFVLPSFAENLPVAIMEALALGRPVISTYIGGIPELVRPDENGWLVPAGSVSDLVAAMREALTLPVEELNRMGRMGAKRVSQRHNAATEAHKLAALIEEAAPSPSHSARDV